MSLDTLTSMQIYIEVYLQDGRVFLCAVNDNLLLILAQKQVMLKSNKLRAAG